MIPSVTLTSAGAALLAKTPAGESVPVTRWQIGTGALEPGTSLDRTALVSPLKYIGIYSVTNKETQATVLGQFTNQGMDAFDFEELALLAQDPDQGEVVLCYGNAFGQGEAIQAGTAQLREFIFGAQLTFSGQANVTAQVDQSLVFIPLSQKGQPDGVASLDGEGKVPEEQLPEMNYDPAGSAEAVQEALEAHTGNQKNPHGVTAEQAGAAEAEHTHVADDITSGTLNTSRLPTIPVNKGGTGKTSWTANRLIYPSGSTALSQLAFPSSAGSVLRQGTSGAPYWSSIADLVTAMGAVRIKCGTYTGNGAYDSESSHTSNPQTINVGLNPKAVLVMSETGSMDSGSGRYYGGLVWDGSDLVVFLDTNYGDINAKVITLTNSGFTVYAQRVQMGSSYYRYIATNEDGLKYRYIVFY